MWRCICARGEPMCAAQRCGSPQGLPQCKGDGSALEAQHLKPHGSLALPHGKELRTRRAVQCAVPVCVRVPLGRSRAFVYRHARLR